MQKGSSGYNVLPQEASVCANLRFIPHQSTDESIELITNLAKEYDIETEVLYRGYPSASLDLNGKAFHMVKETIQNCFPGIGIMPYVVTGGTDCRFYGEVCDNCVRFSPVNYGPEQMAGMHGLNENIETACLPGAVDYYKAIVRAQEK
jgi:carboxypeptidase PM20D1